MLKNAARIAWKILPAYFRLKIIRLTQTKFTVSAAAVILNERNEVLLLNHVLRPFSGWGLPGGFIESGEEPEAAIRREIREETGVELEGLRMIRVRIVRSHVEMLFAAATSGIAEVKSREIIGLGWFTMETLPAGLARSQREVIGQVLNSEI